MKADLLLPHARLVLLTMPHPATLQAATFLQAIVAAGEDRIACELVTDGDRVLGADEIALYLRPAAADVLALAVMAGPIGAGELQAAGARLAELDDRWRHVPHLSLEDLLAKPQEAVCFLSHHLKTPLGNRSLAEAEARIDALRKGVAGQEHPLAFLASLDPSIPEATWMDDGLYDEIRDYISPNAPRHLLVLEGKGSSDIGDVLPDSAEWIVSTIPFDSKTSAQLEVITIPQGVIHLHHVGNAALPSDLLDLIMARLAPMGLVSGEERSETAVQSIVARLTQGGSNHNLVFLLSGPRWLATSRSWRH